MPLFVAFFVLYTLVTTLLMDTQCFRENKLVAVFTEADNVVNSIDVDFNLTCNIRKGLTSYHVCVYQLTAL